MHQQQDHEPEIVNELQAMDMDQEDEEDEGEGEEDEDDMQQHQMNDPNHYNQHIDIDR